MSASDSPPRDTPITARTLNRERVRASQHVAAAIARELRNPVFALASAAQLLRYRSSDDPIIERNLGRILRETERLNGLVAALLEYGRPAPLEPVPGDPDDVWATVLAAHRGTLESKALLAHYTPATPRVTCPIDAEQLATALGNALDNAAEAAPEGTDITIESSVARDGSWRTTLRNAGEPIAPELLASVFEPLVSTKPGHTGTGLSVAQRVVAEHGGAISLDNGDGGDSRDGVTLSITLPAARAT